jgi:hypothetical protein
LKSLSLTPENRQNIFYHQYYSTFREGSKGRRKREGEEEKKGGRNRRRICIRGYK